MSKVKSAITVSTTTLYNYDNDWCNSNFNYTSASSWTLNLISNFTWQWKLRLEGKFRDSWNWWEFSEVVYTWNVSENSHSFYWYSQYSINANINWTGSIWLKFTKYSGRSWYDSYARAYYDFMIPWTTWVKWPVRWLSEIWEIWSFTSFWRHLDWTWISN